MPLEPLADKWRAFNWHVIEVGGHDFRALNQAIEEAQDIHDKPIVVIAHTIPGKGVHEFERDFRWHGYDPNSGKSKDDYKMALHELRTLGGKIKSEHQ